MRVFLMMALIIPFLHKVLKSAGVLSTIFVITLIITAQHFLIEILTMVPNRLISFVLEETVVYCVGFSPLAVLGLKIKEFRKWGTGLIFLASGIVILVYLNNNDYIFAPQLYKYPPRFLYITYGLFGCSGLWLIRGIFERVKTAQVFIYISNNSMWLYLWHIIPIMAIGHIATTTYQWAGLYILVLIAALLLNLLYSKLVTLLWDTTGFKFVKYLK